MYVCVCVYMHIYFCQVHRLRLDNDSQKCGRGSVCDEVWMAAVWTVGFPENRYSSYIRADVKRGRKRNEGFRDRYTVGRESTD